MPNLNPSDLAQFSGSTSFYRHHFNRAVLYTDGIKYLADQGGAYWLVDSIAIHLASDVFRKAAQKDDRIRLISFWKLSVQEDRSAELTAKADSDEPVFLSESIPYTDFPLNEIDIWTAANELNGYTLLLPSEY